MRKILFVLLICCLLSSDVLARGLMSFWSGVVVASCSTSSDSEIVEYNDYASSSEVWANFASRFILTSDSIITEYVLYSIRDDGSDVGSIDVSIYNDNSNVPGTIVSSSTVNILSTSISSSYSTLTVTLPATINLSAGTYWIVIRSIDSSVIRWHYDSTPGARLCRDSTCLS